MSLASLFLGAFTRVLTGVAARCWPAERRNRETDPLCRNNSASCLTAAGSVEVARP
jgi:hypothetical protein